MTALIGTTFLRFLAVGGAMALVYALLAAIATAHLPWPRAASAAAAWIACIPAGFWLQRRVTFSDSTPHHHALGLYALTQAVGMAIGAAISAIFARGHFGPDLAVHLSASFLAAVASYSINRRVTFPRRSQPETGSAHVESPRT